MDNSIVELTNNEVEGFPDYGNFPLLEIMEREARNRPLTGNQKLTKKILEQLALYDKIQMTTEMEKQDAPEFQVVNNLQILDMDSNNNNIMESETNNEVESFPDYGPFPLLEIMEREARNRPLTKNQKLTQKILEQLALYDEIQVTTEKEKQNFEESQIRNF